MLEGRLWITKDNQNFLGCGRISLLEQIQITGSIHAAAKAMKMSYKTAWDSIDAMNNLSDEPLVVRVSGGKGGGGTHLTSKGKEIIEAFHNLEAKHQQFLELLNSEHDSIEKIVSVVDRLSLKLSARNQIIGKISSLKADAVNVVVELTIKNFDTLYSSITLASFDTLGININEKAIAIIKASSILLSKDKDAYEEYENRCVGKITHIVHGSVNTEVTLELPSQATLTATLDNQTYDKESFVVGQEVCAFFKANDVILGV